MYINIIIIIITFQKMSWKLFQLAMKQVME